MWPAPGQLHLILYLAKLKVAGEGFGVVSSLPYPLETNGLNSGPTGRFKAGLQESSLKRLKSLLSLWGPNQLVSFGLLSLNYTFR